MEEFDFEQELADEEYIAHRRRVISVIMCGVLLLLLFFGVFSAYRIQHAQDKRIREDSEKYNDELLPLFEERAQLEKEIYAVNETKISVDQFYGTVIFLCVEPGEWITEDIKPLFDAYAYTGMIAVSCDKYLGDDGFLSVDETKELVKKGWELCVSVQTLEQAKELKERLSSDGFALPATVYLPSGTIEDSIDVFATAGFTNVITHGSEEGSLVWCARAKGCRETGTKTYLSNAVRACDCVVFTIGPLYTREAYTVSTMNSMLSAVNDYDTAGQTEVCDIALARERRFEFEDVIGTQERELVERKAKLESRLAEVEAAIMNYNNNDFK